MDLAKAYTALELVAMEPPLGLKMKKPLCTHARKHLKHQWWRQKLSHGSTMALNQAHTRILRI
jgi:hypothetical protein